MSANTTARELQHQVNRTELSWSFRCVPRLSTTRTFTPSTLSPVTHIAKR
jgi:hypothetical protein